MENEFSSQIGCVVCVCVPMSFVLPVSKCLNKVFSIHTFKDSRGGSKDNETTKTRVEIPHFMHALSSIGSKQDYMILKGSFILANMQAGRVCGEDEPLSMMMLPPIC